MTTTPTLSATIDTAAEAAAPMPLLRAYCIARADARSARIGESERSRLRAEAGTLRTRARGAELEAIRTAIKLLLADRGAVDALSIYRAARREALEAAAAKAAAAAAKAARKVEAECQICGRMIGTTRRGTLAKHGHSIVNKVGRFGGFHTADCDGSGFLGFALACDAIAPAAERRERGAARLEAEAAELEAGRATIPARRELRAGAWRQVEAIPPEAPLYAKAAPRRAAEHRQDAAALRAEAAALRKRLAAWQAPAAA